MRRQALYRALARVKGEAMAADSASITIEFEFTSDAPKVCAVLAGAKLAPCTCYDGAPGCHRA